MRGFRLVIEELPDGAVGLALTGELDLEHAYTFDEELRRVEAREPHLIVLDCRELRFLDSCGMARLIAAHRRARRAGRRLVVVRGKVVQRLFALTAVDDLLETATDVAGALSG